MKKQIGQYWVVKAYQGSVFIYPNKTCTNSTALAAVSQLPNGSITIALSGSIPDMRDLTINESRLLSSVLDTAATIAEDWDSF